MNVVDVEVLVAHGDGEGFASCGVNDYDEMAVL